MDLVATGDWQGGTLSGDFSPDWPDYQWQAIVQDWTQNGLEQVDLHVTWKDRSGNREIVLSTLVYNGVNAGTTNASSSSTSTGTSTATGGTGSKSSSGGGK